MTMMNHHIYTRKFFSASRWKSMKYTLEPAMTIRRG